MAFDIFERWPWTSFQNLNLDWLMQAVKKAVTRSAEAIAKATAVETELGTYTNRINEANENANQALSIARNANEVLFISADAENKAVNYVNYSQGETVYVTAQDIFSAITADHKVPIFMDNMLYVYDLAGYETNPEQPLMVTRFKFTKESENSTDIAWIDRNGSITYTRIDGGANGFPVVFNYIPQNPELPASGYWDSDKTYAEILAAINNGKSIFLTVKIDGETREIINNAYIHKSANPTYLVLGYSKGFDIYDSPYYTNTGDFLVYYTINSNEFISVGRVHTVPAAGTSHTDEVLTVNSLGYPEWLPASGRGAVPRVLLSANSANIPPLSSNTLYVFTGNATALNIQLAIPGNTDIANEYHFIFNSGATPTTLSVPSGIHWPDGFAVEANHVYEVSILENNMTAQGWAVSA